MDLEFINTNNIRVDEYKARKEVQYRERELAKGEKYNVYNKLARQEQLDQLTDEYMLLHGKDMVNPEKHKELE